MAMYEDLVKQLRYCADATTCRNCLWKTECCPTDMQKKAADAIEELRKAVLRLEDESGIYDELPTFYIYPTKWIPVTERLPCLTTPVLATDGIEVDIAWMYGVPPRWITSFTAIDEDKLTHWMPLPQTPKDGD